MASLKEVKNRISSVKSTRQITSAMKMVASAKLHKAQGRIENMLPYQRKLNEILTNFLSTDVTVESPYTEERPVGKVAIVAFSSNSSLCGAFNSNVAKMLERTLEDYRSLGKENILVYPVGKKVEEAVKKLGYEPQGSYQEMADKPSYVQAYELAGRLMKEFLEGRIDSVFKGQNLMMVLYSGMTCPFSHSCRFVLFEKGCEFEIQDIDMFQPIDVSSLNPYGEVPILRERELTLYQAEVINMYIDDRFPHPQLMPPDPMHRARARLFLYILNREIFSQVRILENRNLSDEMHENARGKLRDQLSVIGSRLTNGMYLLGEEFSLLDVMLAPVLWRLSHYGIELPRSAAPLMTYGERLFSRPAFIDSMTPSERVMRR